MSQSHGLWARFEALSSSLDTSAVSAIRLDAAERHLLVKGKFGEPILLLAATPRTSPRAPIRLKHVSVAFDAQYEVTNTDSGGTTTGTYCKFTSDPDSVSLHPYFVEFLASTARMHESSLQQFEVDGIVDATLELFRKLATSPKNTVTGLWGELLLIHAAEYPDVFLKAWHIAGTDVFDFAFDDARVEVKTTERRTREHEFSLEQVRGGRAEDTVASVMLTRSAAGLSVLDLTRKIASRVSVDQQEKLWSLVLETLGHDAENCDDQKFDEKAALNSISLIPALAIPAPEIMEEDAATITNVRFKANVSDASARSALNVEEFLRRKP